MRDVAEKMDQLGTLRSCGAPNFRQVRGGLPVFGMGQPSLSGFRQVLQKLQKDGHKVSMVRFQAGASPPRLGNGAPGRGNFRGFEGSWPQEGEGAGDMVQALSTMTVFVVSMGGNSEQMFTALSCEDIAASRSEAPIHPTLRASQEVRKVTG